MKKIVLGLLSVFVAGFGLAFAGTFTDVDSDDFYYDAIELLYDHGVVEGYSNGSFGYDETINRAELLKIAVLAGDVSADDLESYAGDICFFDVPASAWYTQYICYAEAQGWVEGYAGGLFKPAQKINFVEALKIVEKVLGLAYDEDTDPWYKGIVESAGVGRNMIPLTITDFGQIITRAEMADMIARKLKGDEEILYQWLGDKADYMVTYETIEQGENLFLEYDGEVEDVAEDEGDDVDDDDDADDDDDDEDADEKKLTITSHKTGVDPNGLGYYINLKVEDVGLNAGEQYYAECLGGESSNDMYPDTLSSSSDITVYFLKPNTEYKCYVQVSVQGTDWESSGFIYETTLSESKGLETYTDDWVGLSLKYPIGADVEVLDYFVGKVLTIDVPSEFGEGKLIITGDKYHEFTGYDAYAPMGAEMMSWQELGGKLFMTYYSDSVADMGGPLDVSYTSYVYAYPGENYRWIMIERYSENMDVGKYVLGILDTITFGTPSAGL